MSHFIFFIVLLLLTFSDGDTQISSDIQFVCGNSSKCICKQETDRFEHIPLFNIDCSRLELKECFDSSTVHLPIFINHLDLSHNHIEHLNTNRTKLSSNFLLQFDLSYNRIETIREEFFKNLTALTELYLQNNKINQLDQGVFIGLTKLKLLNLEFNELKFLPENIFNPLTNLETLKLSYNNLGAFILSLQENSLFSKILPNYLINLHIDSIGLSNVSNETFSNLTHLVKLSMAYNPIQILPLLSLYDLEYLDISGINITHLSETILMHPRLRVLKMNHISFLTKINDYTFSNLHLLEQLDIEHCIRLEEIDPLAFGFLSNRNSTQRFRLKKISLAHNGLKTLPDTFQFVFNDLDEIRLEGNFWRCDCNLNWMRHVKNIEQIKCVSPDSFINKTLNGLSDQELCESTEQMQKQLLKQQNNSYMPIQKWLFPLIGVLSTIVLFLVGVLIYMGPYETHVRTRVRSLGPESPYNHHITIRPNQAEYLLNT